MSDAATTPEVPEIPEASVTETQEVVPDSQSPMVTVDPIKHDGYKSRRFWGSIGFAILFFFGSSALLAWAGITTQSAIIACVALPATVAGACTLTPWFTETYWVYGLGVSGITLLWGWGLMSFDKLLELIRLVSPTIALYLKSKIDKLLPKK